MFSMFLQVFRCKKRCLFVVCEMILLPYMRIDKAEIAFHCESSCICVVYAQVYVVGW